MSNKINWYPGHMAKTKRLIKEKLNLIDIVYELVDARIPFSSKVNDIDEFTKEKPRILVMTKYDLCDNFETDKWISYYEKKGYKVIKLDLINRNDVGILINLTKEVLSNLDEKRNDKGLLQRRYRALIMGVPNVGKSTLINRLSGKKVVNVGNKPGITKSLNWIRVNNDIEMLDSPGILWPKFDNLDIAYNLASMTSIKEEVLPIDDVACYILRKLYKNYPNKLLERYDISFLDNDNIVEVYDKIGKKRGCLIRGGEIDYDKVSYIIINDLKEGRFGKVTFDIFEDIKK